MRHRSRPGVGQLCQSSLQPSREHNVVVSEAYASFEQSGASREHGWQSEEGDPGFLVSQRPSSASPCALYESER